MLLPARVLLPSLPSLSLLLGILSLLGARLCPQPAMSALRQQKGGDGHTDDAWGRQALEARSIFRSDVTGEASPARDCSASPLRSPEGALSLALEAARGRGRGRLAIAPRASVTALRCGQSGEHRPGADRLFPLLPRMARGGARRVETKSANN